MSTVLIRSQKMSESDSSSVINDGRLISETLAFVKVLFCWCQKMIQNLLQEITGQTEQEQKYLERVEEEDFGQGTVGRVIS